MITVQDLKDLWGNPRECDCGKLQLLSSVAGGAPVEAKQQQQCSTLRSTPTIVSDFSQSDNETHHSTNQNCTKNSRSCLQFNQAESGNWCFSQHLDHICPNSKHAFFCKKDDDTQQSTDTMRTDTLMTWGVNQWKWFFVLWQTGLWTEQMTCISCDNDFSSAIECADDTFNKQKTKDIWKWHFNNAILSSCCTFFVLCFACIVNCLRSLFRPMLKNVMHFELHEIQAFEAPQETTDGFNQEHIMIWQELVRVSESFKSMFWNLWCLQMSSDVPEVCKADQPCSLWSVMKESSHHTTLPRTSIGAMFAQLMSDWKCCENQQKEISCLLSKQQPQKQFQQVAAISHSLHFSMM